MPDEHQDTDARAAAGDVAHDPPDGQAQLIALFSDIASNHARMRRMCLEVGLAPAGDLSAHPAPAFACAQTARDRCAP